MKKEDNRAQAPTNRLKWALFAAFIFLVPVPYFMLVVGGMVPTVCIMYFFVQGLIVALPKFSAERFAMVDGDWPTVKNNMEQWLYSGRDHISLTELNRLSVKLREDAN